MPPKKARKSRLNSTSTTDHSKLRSITATKTLLKLEEQSSEDHSKDCETLDYTDEIETEEASIDSNQATSRYVFYYISWRNNHQF